MRIILFCLLLTISAHAGFVSDFVDRQSNGQLGGEYYSSQERGYVTLGSYSERIPNVTINPVSITPPSISAGCSGIDVVTGGVSFLRKDALMNLYKQLSDGGTLAYMGISMALKMLSTEYADNIEQAMDIIQKINALQLDGCGIAESAVTFVADSASSGIGSAVKERTNRAMNMLRRGESDSADEAMRDAASPSAAAADKDKVLKDYSAKEYLARGGSLIEYVYTTWRSNGSGGSAGSFSFPNDINVGRVRALYGDVVYDPSKEQPFQMIPPCKEIATLADVAAGFYTRDSVLAGGECRLISEESINEYVDAGMEGLYDAYTGIASTIDENFIKALSGTSVLTFVKQDAGARDTLYLRSSMAYLKSLAKTELAYKYADLYQQHMGETLQKFADDAAANAGTYGIGLVQNTDELVQRAKLRYYNFNAEYVKASQSSLQYLLQKRELEQAKQRGSNRVISAFRSR